MNLAKALKEKNRLAGEVSQFKELLKAQNCRPTGQPFDYDNREVLASLRASVDRLVAVKTAIAQANAQAYDKIFRLAELKGLVATLRELNTTEGIFAERRGYGEPAYEVEYRAQLRKVEVDRFLAEAELEIQAIQDELDEFNVSRRIGVK